MKWYAFALAATMVSAAASAQVIPENTPVTVRTLEEVSSKTAQVGDPVRMEVIDDIVVNGVTVVPAGTPAYGEVTAAQKNGHIGKSGKLTIEVEGVRYGNGRMRLRGSRDSQGSGGGTAAIATAALVSPLGLLIHGKSAAVPIHTRFMAYVANDTPMVGAMVQPLPSNGTGSSRTRGRR
ncbi:hypothetical protein [Sphingomonas bacterium]|uniref:hypothetical protein n=1 Tax=Sphingomonas bacterium TaxID=1895847 RepID=UPI001576D7FA|nr:hypothetical protein [Sphingomonas bacterium]